MSTSYEENTLETVSYFQDDCVSLELLVVKPVGWQSTDLRSAVVWIHGGGWERGEPAMLLPQCRYFAKRGAVSFSVQYRLLTALPKAEASDDSEIPNRTIVDCLTDCKTALRYIRSHAKAFGIHTARIAVAGDSAGGYLAAGLGMLDEFDREDEDTSISSKADLIVMCSGIVDLTRKWKSYVPFNGAAGDAVEEQEQAEHTIHDWNKRHEYAKRLSPLYQAAVGQPPMLVMHGLEDTTVEPVEAAHFYDAYAKAGNEAELVLLPKLRHAFIIYGYSATDEQVKTALAIMDDFLTSKQFLEPRQL
ncbi:alpha/beta hydrolase [Paenibacillus paridis]|uniref:alpha/beta hydrolase n=1 Tax=Paenibacillus paridis TaxID=2583376 RepID=UPI0013917155|nr:alpha/beta hydrolase [Paenibacillus paridis]